MALEGFQTPGNKYLTDRGLTLLSCLKNLEEIHNSVLSGGVTQELLFCLFSDSLAYKLLYLYSE